MSNMGTVREIYEAFGRGDVLAIFYELDEGVVSGRHRVRLRAYRGFNRAVEKQTLPLFSNR